MLKWRERLSEKLRFQKNQSVKRDRLRPWRHLAVHRKKGQKPLHIRAIQISRMLFSAENYEIFRPIEVRLNGPPAVISRRHEGFHGLEKGGFGHRLRP